jgi:hypothetical protein
MNEFNPHYFLYHYYDTSRQQQGFRVPSVPAPAQHIGRREKEILVAFGRHHITDQSPLPGGGFLSLTSYNSILCCSLYLIFCSNI